MQSSETEVFTFPAEDCLQVFCEYMEVKAEDLGLSNNTFFQDPCGIQNKSTAKDMLRCLLRANESAALRKIWSKKEYTVTIEGKNARELPLYSTVLADADSHILTDHYTVLGGKTGTLEKHGAYNLSVIVKIPESDDLLACTVMYAKTPNGSEHNRFKAAKEVLDAAVVKYKDRGANVANVPVCAESAICCVVPPLCQNGEYHAKLEVLFEKDIAAIKMPASMTKMLTAVIALEYFPDTDEKITVEKAYLDVVPEPFNAGDFKAGDVVCVGDLLHAMMLPSSNAAAYILACCAGNKIFSEAL